METKIKDISQNHVDIKDSNLKIAIVCDFLKIYGGAERHLEAIMEVFPDAPIFTTLYLKDKLPDKFRKYHVIESKYHKLFKYFGPLMTPLYPIAFEEFNFDEYDIVLSFTAGFAKNIIVSDKTIHIAYILTPPRFLWGLPNSRQDSISGIKKIPLYFLNNYLRIIDFASAQRADYIFTISNAVSKRVKKFYRRDSVVIYPYVDTDKFIKNDKFTDGDYFLIVSRLEKYKNIDIAIKACIKLKYKLKIIGDGGYKNQLKEISSSNIEFLGNVEDDEMIDIINGSKAVIFPGAEDFGLVPIEAQACGKGVVALFKDGATESIKDKITGYFFYDINMLGDSSLGSRSGSRSLEKALKKIYDNPANPIECIDNAKRFSKDIFRKNLENKINNIIKKDDI
ncbi:MAG: glycosyltransferase [Patescibacteria group bacterium]